MSDSNNINDIISFACNTDIPRPLSESGFGAYGFFIPSQEAQKSCCAEFLNARKKFSVYLRLSDLFPPRNGIRLRGWGLKIYAPGENIDFVGTNLPVVFASDTKGFINCSAALGGSGEYGEKHLRHITEYIASDSRMLNFFIRLLSGKYDTDDLIFKGYGLHAFIITSTGGKLRAAKFNIKPSNELKCSTLSEAIRQGVFPEFSFYATVTRSFLDKNAVNPVIPWEGEGYSEISFGKIILNRFSENPLRDSRDCVFDTPPDYDSLYLPENAPLRDHYLASRISGGRRLGADYKNLKVNAPVYSGETVKIYKRPDGNASGRINFSNENSSVCGYAVSAFIDSLDEDELTVLLGNTEKLLDECKYDVRKRIMISLLKLSDKFNALAYKYC